MKKREHLDKIAGKSSAEIKYFEADLLNFGTYKEAMEGCQLVFLTASPFFLDSKDAQKELIEPALEGTKNILNSVNETESVKRVVLTSSVAAIYGDTIDSKMVTDGIFDETMWNTTSSPEAGNIATQRQLRKRGMENLW